MRKVSGPLLAALAAVWAFASATETAGESEATPLALSTAPMLVDGKLPAPNVFVAIADGGHGADLKAALDSAFGSQRIADGGINLGWQASQQCEALPDGGALCHERNAPAPLDHARRVELSEFAQRLANGAARRAESPSAQTLVDTAQAYLTSSPSAGKRSATPILKCRKSHLLLATRQGDDAVEPKQDSTAQEADRPKLSIHGIGTGTGDLVRSMSEAVDTALSESQSLPTRTIASLAAAPVAASAAPVTVFAARYDANRWSGEVAAQTHDGGNGAAPWGAREGSSQPHTTASLLDRRDPDTRVTVSSKGEGDAFRAIAFQWQQLAPSQQAELNGVDDLGQQRLQYLRGDRSAEQSSGGIFRDRESRQGDSVNSGLWHVAGREAKGDTPATPAMLYVGSNDGMLHGFFAQSGAEAFAYVPQGVYAHLAALTRPQYRHQYSVDGSPWTAEMPQAGGTKTLLAGSLGAGGRGYFVLDVSNPTGFSESEQAGAKVPMLDTTASADPHIGHIVGEPVQDRADPSRSQQITRLNNGRWALILGNGYGSEKQSAMLLIQYLDGARELMKLSAGTAGGNGLSTVRLLDKDGDRVPDVAYAGDLLGNLWKFDLRSASADDWKVAFGGQPLFRARDANGKPQPITAAPVSMPHPAGGHMIVLGTGRLLTDADRGESATQSIYGIHDRDDAGPVAEGRSALVQQSIEPAPVGTASGQQLWTSTNHAVPTSGDLAKRGWYVDLPVVGERVIANPREYDGKLVDVVSMAPPAAFMNATLQESCEAAAIRNFRTTLNALDGARPRSQLYGEPGTAPNAASRIELSGQPTAPLKSAGKERAIRFDGSEEATRHRLGLVARRAGWRQLR
jgi:type IV pilus assembly protein PilY1